MADRFSQVVAESYVNEPDAKARPSQVVAEVFASESPPARVSQLAVEVWIPVSDLAASVSSLPQVVVCG